MTVFILYQTDQWKSKASKVCFGVFSTKELAIDAAKAKGLYNNEREVEIIETTLNEFKEL